MKTRMYIYRNVHMHLKINVTAVNWQVRSMWHDKAKSFDTYSTRSSRLYASFQLSYVFVFLPLSYSLFLLFSSFVVSSSIAAVVPWSLTHFTTKFVYSDERSQVQLFIHFYTLRILLQIHYSVCHFSPKIRLSATRLRRCCQVLDRFREFISRSHPVSVT